MVWHRRYAIIFDLVQFDIDRIWPRCLVLEAGRNRCCCHAVSRMFGLIALVTTVVHLVSSSTVLTILTNMNEKH